MNTWSGIGRLARDPELTYAPAGTAVCRLRIAVDGAGPSDGAGWAQVIEIHASRLDYIALRDDTTVA